MQELFANRLFTVDKHNRSHWKSALIQTLVIKWGLQLFFMFNITITSI